MGFLPDDAESDDAGLVDAKGVIMRVVDNPVCPICHSNEVKGFKVCDANGVWWHRCISRLDHGICVYEGRNIEWPEYPWFTSDGLCEIEVDGKVRHVRIDYQAYQDEQLSLL